MFSIWVPRCTGLLRMTQSHLQTFQCRPLFIMVNLENVRGSCGTNFLVAYSSTSGVSLYMQMTLLKTSLIRNPTLTVTAFNLSCSKIFEPKCFRCIDESGGTFSLTLKFPHETEKHTFRSLILSGGLTSVHKNV